MMMPSTHLAIHGVGTPTVCMGHVTSKDLASRTLESGSLLSEGAGKSHSWCVVEAAFCLKSLPLVRPADAH